MNLYLQFPTNLKLLELYAKDKSLVIGGNSKKEKEIAHFFMKNFPGEVMNEQSVQYETNFLAIRKLKKKDKDIFNKVRGIYYGNDNCEFLTPTLDEITKAYNLFLKIRKRDSIEGGFTFVTPYVGAKMMNRIKPVLDYLNNANPRKPIEIVINDLGVLHYIKKNCSNLQVIAGRLLHKLLKTPLVDTYGNKAHVPGALLANKNTQEIKLLQENIVKWQNKYYQSCEKSFSPLKNFLKRNNIDRVTLDYLENRGTLYKEDSIDVNYPYALIFTGRLCDTSAIEKPERGNYALDDICSRTCFRYDLKYKIKTVGYNMLQKGNAGYRTEVDLDKMDEGFFKGKKNRLIFSPFL